MTFSYLASPYSDDDPIIRAERYEAARECVNWLLLARQWVYSPIVHCHNLSVQWPDATAARDYNYAMLRQARDLLVLCIDGWEDSPGVAGELSFANALPIPVLFLTPASKRDYGYDFTPKPAFAKIPMIRGLSR